MQNVRGQSARHVVVLMLSETEYLGSYLGPYGFCPLLERRYVQSGMEDSSDAGTNDRRNRVAPLKHYFRIKRFVQSIILRIPVVGLIYTTRRTGSSQLFPCCNEDPTLLYIGSTSLVSKSVTATLRYVNDKKNSLHQCHVAV